MEASMGSANQGIVIEGVGGSEPAKCRWRPGGLRRFRRLPARKRFYICGNTPDKLSFSLTSKAVYDYVSGSWGPEKLLDLVERFPRPGRSSFLRPSSRVPLPLSREAHPGSRLLSCDGFSNVSLRKVAAQMIVCQPVLAVLVLARIYPVPGRSG